MSNEDLRATMWRSEHRLHRDAMSVQEARDGWSEVMPEEERVDTGVFFEDPCADWAAIVAITLALAVLAAVVPGPAWVTR